jgi:hypothetical protein
VEDTLGESARVERSGQSRGAICGSGFGPPICSRELANARMHMGASPPAALVLHTAAQILRSNGAYSEVRLIPEIEFRNLNSVFGQPFTQLHYEHFDRR